MACRPGLLRQQDKGVDMLLSLLKRTWRNPWEPGFLLLLLIINIIGSIYGYWWYHHQLSATPVYFWPVVPDSPFSTTLFALMLLTAAAGWRFTVLQAVAVTACIKYGVWAAALISHFWLIYGDISWTEIMLWISHLGMVVQAVWFWPRAGIKLLAALTASFWLFLNDIMDYLFNLHPYLFAPDQLSFAAVSAVLLSLLLTAGLFFIIRKV